MESLVSALGMILLSDEDGDDGKMYRDRIGRNQMEHLIVGEMYDVG